MARIQEKGASKGIVTNRKVRQSETK